MVVTCNCTAVALCARNETWTVRPTQDSAEQVAGDPQLCDEDNAPIEGPNGGAGVLLSVGLMRRVTLQAIDPCFQEHPHWREFLT